MMDQAFLSFSDALAEMLTIPGGELVDEDAGVRSHITQVTFELPIELDVSRDESGVLTLGSAPPLYYVDTSYRPSYHRLRVTASRTEVSDGR
jgi:hypothetical protein